VTTSGGINKNDVDIHIVQTSQSFPWGTAVNVYKYNENAAHGKYRDFIHKHFTWAVPENALKWPSIEPTRGHRNYQPALDFINGVRHHGLKVRGHNLVWSVDRWVQDWVKQLHGDELRNVVKHHIDETMAKTCNLCYEVYKSTDSREMDYLQQARRVKAANVGLYGLGVQCHFGENHNPDIHAVR
ncbi:hypothetical protein BaRGS_00001692, partial [Batillaria attramentaria]